MVRCVVCSEGSQSAEKLTFHNFPRDPKRRQIWLARTRDHMANGELVEWVFKRPLKEWDEIIDTWKVCSRHFEQRCFQESTLKRMLTLTAVPTLFSEEEMSKHKQRAPPTTTHAEPKLRPLKPKEPGQEHIWEAERKTAVNTEDVPGIYITNVTRRILNEVPKVKEIGKRKRSEDTADVPAKSLTPVYLPSQQTRWQGACNTLELTDDQMAKFLLDRYYKGDKSVSAFTGSQITHKTLLLDRGLLTLWNDTMDAKGFSSDKDFLWFLLLGPQKSVTNCERCTVKDRVASDECVPVKVDYIGPGCAVSSDTSQDLNDAANLPLILQPPAQKPGLTQKKSVTETVMTKPKPVTLIKSNMEVKSNEVQKPRQKRKRKKVQEVTKDDPVFLESSYKDSSNVVCNYTAPTQQSVLKVGGTEKTLTSTQTLDLVRDPSDTHPPKSTKTRKQVQHVSIPMDKPAKNLDSCESTTTSCDEDLKEEHELEIDLDNCHRTVTSQLSSDTVNNPEDRFEKKIVSGDNHVPSSQLRWAAVKIKVEKEDGVERDQNTSSFPHPGIHVKEGYRVDHDSCDMNTFQSSCDTVNIKVEKEDELEESFGSNGGMNASTDSSFDTGDIQEEELEMHLNMAIMATAKHLG
ncbi:uncharacterized protein LOC118417250 [Branchiostoma floridae]|uniref:Uncharacterized protein LOC118417250 n=1 Tax=Branchiostoma floridae TaxID=7739 RepID=A0A9J7L9P7_BRAFL|nr:uncharacterized protein LOC118417250 [Branchiostoma floridae]